MPRAGWVAVIAFTALVTAIGTARPALANVAAITLTVTGGGAVHFTSSDNTSTALAAGAPLTASVTVTTKNGGGQIWINSPANPVGAGGATLNLTWITVTCVDTGGSGWLSGGTATLVPNGPSAACATIPAQINNQTTTLSITFTMDARTALGDVWSAAPGFSLGGSAF